MALACCSSGFHEPYTMDRNIYIEIHPTQAQVANISYLHPSKYLNQNVSPQLQYLLFRIMCLFSEKWVCKQVLNDHNVLCSLQCKTHFDLVSGFTWYLMYRIISLSRLTYAPGIFPVILSKLYKLLISSQHWETRYLHGSPSQNIVSSL